MTNHEEDLGLLAQTFRATNWRLRSGKSYRQAVMILCQERMPVIICQCCLPDGSWKDILSRIVDLPDAPRLIVASAEPVDYLCAEVINLGGYDVLTTPFDPREVVWAVGCACRNWESEFGRVQRRWSDTRFFAQSA